MSLVKNLGADTRGGNNPVYCSVRYSCYLAQTVDEGINHLVQTTSIPYIWYLVEVLSGQREGPVIAVYLFFKGKIEAVNRLVASKDT